MRTGETTPFHVLRATLGQSMTPSLAAEAESLATETDPRLRAEGVLALAGRLERSDSFAEQGAAFQLYQSLVAQDLPESSRARERIAAMTGQGGFGARAETMLRSFARQASDPAMILGMGVAAGVFSLSRATVLSRLLASSSSTWLTRGLGARTLASLAGFALEAPGFTLATRLGQTALGGEIDWSRAGLARDLASGYLSLGAMRLSYAAAGAVTQRMSVPSAPLFRQGTALAGLWLGHGLERFAGLRSSRDPALSFADSLAMLLQFHVAGRLSREFLGGPAANLEASLDLASRLPEAGRGASGVSPLGEGLRDFFGPRLAPNGVGEGAWSGLGARELHPLHVQPMQMSALRPGRDGGTPGPRLEGRFDQLVRPEFHDRSVSPPPRNGKHVRRPVRRIGILTSGGDGPGENAAIEALVRGAIQMHGWEPIGIFDGFRGLLEPAGRIRELGLDDVQGEAAVRNALRSLYGGRMPAGLSPDHASIATLGGDILRSSRTNPVQGDPQASRVKQTLRQHGIDALVVLGGNGSMRAAEALRQAGVSVVGIPQSIDLDVWGSEHSIGFPSAVAKGAGEVFHFHNTAHSCDRWFLVEVMGQHYGMLTLAVGRESRVADSVFIEVPRPLGDVRDIIDRRRPGRRHGVLLFSEGVKFRGEGVSVIEPPRGTDVHGRLVIESGDVVRWLRGPLAELGISHTRPESLGYLLRGAAPTPEELGLARVLAEGALNLAAAGRFGRMVGTGFEGDSVALRTVYPRLSRVAQRQKPPPEEYFHYVRDLLEGR